MAETSSQGLTRDQTTRVCRTCGEVRAIEQFRRRSRNSHLRFRQCRECHNESMRRHRAAKTARNRKAQVEEQLTRLQDARTQTARLRIIDEVNRRIGPERFAQAFHEVWQQAKRDGSTHARMRLLQFYGTLRMAVTGAETATASQLERQRG